MSMSNNLPSFQLPLALSLVALVGFGLISCDPHPWAENVCNVTIPIKKDIVIEKPVQYEIKVQSMCGLLPCVKTRMETRTDQSIKSILQQVERATCCPGYTETPEKKCAPICLQSCNNGGKCVGPNTCRCQSQPSESSPGFVGPTCGRFVCLNDAMWGAKCDRPCSCSGNSYCGADTGKCLCYPGWRGTNCTIECDPFSNSAECEESNRLPPIIEPESNLMSSNLVFERQQHKPEALVLDDDVKIIADESTDWRSLTSSSLIYLLSVSSLVFLVAFLVIKRRYNRMRNELYYSSSTYPGSSGRRSSAYSEPPPYEESSASSQISTGASRVVVPSNSGNLGKNFSFATATRNILLGKDLNSLDGAKNDGRNMVVFQPRIESHLIESQKKAEQNVYSDVVLNMNEGCRPPAYSSSDDHVYQVPRSLSPSASARADLSADESLLNQNTSSASDRTIEDDSTSNIYEEIKPRK